MNKECYRVGTALDMSRIPAAARERFLAELPAILDHIPQIEAALPAIAADARKRVPAWARWMFPRWAVTESLRRQLINKMIWVDDDKGTVTFSVRSGQHGEPFYSRTVSLHDAPNGQPDA